MKNLLTTLFLFSYFCVMAQESSITNPSGYVITPEFMLGISAEANDFFPERSLQKQVIIGFGREHTYNSQEWAYWLNAPKTAVTLGVTDFGNTEAIGYAFSAMPIIEFNVLKSKRFKIITGMGVSYFPIKYDPIKNPFNQAITTDISWSFRAGFNYEFLQTQKIDWRLGIGYYHHSNGHTKLPNQGLNSFLFSVSADIKKSEKEVLETFAEKNIPERSIYTFTSLRFGYGTNVLALSFNDKKPIYTIAGEYGKVINKTYKLGVGFYYRYYDHYYDYIKNNESLVQEGKEFEKFKENPWHNATTLGVSVNAEFLLNHIGIDFQIGANLYKPAYKIDWRINEGWDNAPRDIPDNWVFGEFDTKYQLKQIISSRMGLKYYLFGTNDVPKNNVFIAAHINSNLGQADFTEVSLGYVYSFNLKSRN
ncbi:MAG: acyloxyacyl hydrolase [Flavobacteriaceae bacterium]